MICTCYLHPPFVSVSDCVLDARGGCVCRALPTAVRGTPDDAEIDGVAKLIAYALNELSTRYGGDPLPLHIPGPVCLVHDQKGAKR